VVYVWILFLLIGSAKPMWRWLQRRRAMGWPTVQGRIESTSVAQKKSFWTGNRNPFTAELAYSYTLDGQYLSGVYSRLFPTEAEGAEFVRDLQGVTAIVSYNPHRPEESTLTDASVSNLLAMRPPRPEGDFEIPVAAVPSWTKPLLWPLVGLAALGLVLSLWVHFGAVLGQRSRPKPFSLACTLAQSQSGSPQWLLRWQQPNGSAHCVNWGGKKESDPAEKMQPNGSTARK
jgi:hypothetical protein